VRGLVIKAENAERSTSNAEYRSSH